MARARVLEPIISNDIVEVVEQVNNMIDELNEVSEENALLQDNIARLEPLKVSRAQDTPTERAIIEAYNHLISVLKGEF